MHQPGFGHNQHCVGRTNGQIDTNLIEQIYRDNGIILIPQCKLGNAVIQCRNVLPTQVSVKIYHTQILSFNSFKDTKTKKETLS